MSDIALPNSGVPELPRAERLLNDELLAKLTGRGSGRAFATLYERHHQAIYRYCRSILRDDHDAQDALQSAMTRAYAALRARERDLAVRPWLFRIAHNEAISITRRHGHQQTLDEVRELSCAGVEETLELRQRLSQLVSDMRELPERQRAALVMREMSGLSIEEIAGALAISQGAAKQTLFEARSSLHELAKGREMDCEVVREAISLRDGRVLRGRRVGAHLRDCAECREFRAAIGARGADFRALAPPLPAATASAMLGQLLLHGSGHASGTAASGALGGHASGSAVSGASLGGHAAASLIAKGLVGMAVVAAAAGTVRLTVEPHRSQATPSYSRGGDTHGAPQTRVISPATEKSRRVSTSDGSSTGTNSRRNASRDSGVSRAGASMGADMTTQAASSTPFAQIVHENGAHGGGVAHGGARHSTGNRPASHRAPVHPAKPHRSPRESSHTKHGAAGQGSQSQAAHGQSGATSGESQHTTKAGGEGYVPSREASRGKAGRSSEAGQQVTPQPSR